MADGVGVHIAPGQLTGDLPQQMLRVFSQAAQLIGRGHAVGDGAVLFYGNRQVDRLFQGAVLHGLQYPGILQHQSAAAQLLLNIGGYQLR